MSRLLLLARREGAFIRPSPSAATLGGVARRTRETMLLCEAAGFDKVLHYRVPEPMRAEVQVGSLVRVPILNTLRLGVVGEVGAPRDFPVDRLKAVAQVAYPFPAFTQELLELARWMARYYACGIDSVIETMIPAAVRRGAAIRQERLLAIAHRASAEEIEALARRAPQQARLYGFLAAQVRPQPKGLVLQRLGMTAAVPGALVKRGWLREEARRVERIAYADGQDAGELVQALPHALNPEQQAAVDALARDFR